MKKALITGITGQDGSYLAELLLSKGYEVHGMIRRSSSFNTGRIDHLYRDPHEKDVRLFLHYGDLNDASSINMLLRNIQPDEIYNLGAQSHVRVSFDVPEYTGEVDGLGAVRILEGIRETGLNTRFYQASSSELYGKVVETPQKETTPFYPRSPYACAKAYAFYITMNYRESYGMYACNGILFNHESPRRGETFVTRKITRAAARIKLGMQSASIWAIWTPNATGALPATMSKPCGGCCSRRRLKTTSSPPARPTWCAPLPKRSLTRLGMPLGVAGEWRRQKRASTRSPVRQSSRSIPNISARPRSTCCWATRPRPGVSWGGSPRPVSNSSLP